MEPLPKCQVGKRGRHNLLAFIPEDDDKPVTLICEHCGISRQYPLNVGTRGTLDTEDAETIAAWVDGAG